MKAEDEDPHERDPADQEDRPEETGEEEVVEAPEPEPGLTAPLDYVTDDEKDKGPVAVMPGAGPDADDADAEARRRLHDDEDEEASED